MGATDDIMGVIPPMVVGYGAVKMTDAMFGGNRGRKGKCRRSKGTCSLGNRQKIKMDLPNRKIKMSF